jgi:pimeloyl-ACP methyl ester carboxylesterase
MSVLLVHGAWHGAWCWEAVQAALPDGAVAIDLPSNHGGGGFAADVDAVRAALDGMAAPVVLVGHSYGGAVITEAGTHPNVGHLVYLCAYALDAGESLAANAVPPAEVSLAPQFEDGNLVVEREAARDAFYADCDVQPVDRLVPHPLDAFMTAIESPAWRSTPSTYVVCTEDRAIHPDQQRFMAARCSDVVELSASHSPMLSMPARVAEVITSCHTA